MPQVDGKRHADRGNARRRSYHCLRSERHPRADASPMNRDGKAGPCGATGSPRTPDGYGVRLPTDSTMLHTVAEYSSNERLYCTGVHCTVQVEPQRAPFWLRLTRGEGVKASVRSVFEANA